jgi:hypothetical protein
MGVYYWFADYTNKKYIDGYAAKSGEWKKSAFDQAMIINYLMEHYSNDPIEVKFASDESGDWDEIHEQKFEDYTCENIYNMFEGGYFNDYTSKIWLGNLTWILDKFVRQNKMEIYLEIAKQIPEFMDHYKNTICDTLEESNRPN